MMWGFKLHMILILAVLIPGLATGLGTAEAPDYEGRVLRSNTAVGLSSSHVPEAHG